MDLLQIITLSIVQGITEFLPISSSGHLVLVPYFTGWMDQGIAFDIAVHIGTLLAVMLYFNKEVHRMLKGMGDAVCRKGTDDAWLFWMIVFATLPLIAAAPFLGSLMDGVARNVHLIGFTSIFFGLLLWVADRRPHPDHTELEKEMNYRKAFFIGIAQVLALIPGTSRSGITMTAARFLKFNRREASRFSMLMAMPVILMAGSYAFVSDYDTIDWATRGTELLGGIVFSFVAALLTIHALMKFVERTGFLPFVIYRVILGIFLIVIA